MVGAYKRFDRALYLENDEKARKAIKKLFKDNKKYTVVDNHLKTGVDMLVYSKKGHICNIEAEIKQAFEGDTFKFDTLHIPERKKKYTELDKPTVFIIFNKDLSSFYSIDQDLMLESGLKECSNKYMRSGEMFFDVPTKKALLNKFPNFKKYET